MSSKQEAEEFFKKGVGFMNKDEYLSAKEAFIQAVNLQPTNKAYVDRVISITEKIEEVNALIAGRQETEVVSELVELSIWKASIGKYEESLKIWQDLKDANKHPSAPFAVEYYKYKIEQSAKPTS